MDLIKYKEIVDELVLTKNLEKDPKKKRGLQDFEIRLRKNLRSQEIERKLKNLYDNKQFIGYICVASQFVEFKIKEIVLQLQQLAVSLNKNFKLDKDWEEKALGGLITILKNHCIKDSALIKQLWGFNNLRIKAIHRLFDTTFEINDVESEIETKLTPSFSYYNITASLDKYLYGITVKTFETKDSWDDIPSAEGMYENIFESQNEFNVKNIRAIKISDEFQGRISLDGEARSVLGLSVGEKATISKNVLTVIF
jgi:hypothetical protein